MINRMILQGRLTRDPELKQTQSGLPVVSFTVAWSEKYKEDEKKLFMRCTAWRSTAEFINKYYAKGQEIAVEGQLIARDWTDNEGNNKQTIELIVDKAHFCGSKKDNQATQSNITVDTTDFEEIDDEELPF